MAFRGNRISVETFQPDLLFEAISGAEFEHRLLRGGEFLGQLDRLHLPHCRLDRGCYSLPCFARGAFCEHWIVVGITYCLRERGWANGWELCHNQIQIYSEGHSLDYRSAPNAPWYALQIPRDWLQEESVRLIRRELQLPVRRSSNITVRHSAIASLSMAMDAIFVQDELRHPVRSAQAASRAERRMIELVIAVLSNSTPKEMTQHRSAERKRQFVDRMERYLSDRLTEPFESSDLVAQMGLTERTLRRFCNDAYGLSPIQVFGVARLNRIRQEIQRHRNDTATVRQLAEKWGVAHHGRFAASYRALFREHPRETLSRIQ